MTRETKIGLLVGLAFIIVIGILLSDHLTSSTEPPPAAIAQVGQTVRSGVNTPVGAPQQPPVTVIQPPQVQPQQTVQTANDLTPKPQPVTMVQITPPAQTQTEPVTVAQRPAGEETVIAMNEPAPPTTPVVAQPVNTAAPVVQAVAPTPGAPRQNDPMLARLNGEAQRFGESVVPVGNAPLATAGKYKAEPGDTLARIAQKAYGSSSKAYRDAILNANPALKENPDLVIEGRTYLIPDLKSAVTDAAIVPPVTAAARPRSAQPAPSASDAVYVVEEGDNLTRIAVEHLGSPSGVAAIKELNRDLLKGSDVIRPGMKLRLPAKVAVNN